MLTGPEFGGQKNCVYIGMVTEDLDVSELVETIAATGREIEENSRVGVNKEHLSIFCFSLLPSGQFVGFCFGGFFGWLVGFVFFVVVLQSCCSAPFCKQYSPLVHWVV